MLCAILGDRIPTGPLGPDTVPAKVLTLAVDLAIKELVEHGRKCRDPHCTYVPQPLQRHQRMRPKAIRKARDLVHDVLWTHTDHDLVMLVRTEILEANQDVAREVESNRIFEGDRLAKLLSERASESLRVVAAVLWALRFPGPNSEFLFRILIPLAVGRSSSRAGRTERPASDREVKSLKDTLKTIKRERDQAQKEARDASRALRPKERAYEEARQKLQEIERKYQNAAQEIGRLHEELADRDAAISTLEGEAEKAQQIRNDLRRDLQQRQDDLQRLAVERTDLARQLGSIQRERDRLKLRLDSVPKGADAVWNFLESEEKRIKRDRLILSGRPQRLAEERWTAHRKLKTAFLDAYPEYTRPRPVKLRPKSTLTFDALGGSAEIGRSCYVLEIGKHRIVVDCGIKPGDARDLHPDLERLERLDALILTHAHTDHIGWVPALVRKFGKFDIYCTEGTDDLLPVMLRDCRRHYVREITRRREFAKHRRDPVIIEEAYQDEDVQAVSELTIRCDIGREERLTVGEVSVRFFNAGHILGAASVLLEDQTGRGVFFSGDFSSFEQWTVPAAEWPDDLTERELDLLVLESTYGGTEHHPPLVESRKEFIAFIRDTIDRNGSVIVASFALGRAQELLKLILSARENGDISRSTPIHVDGMIKDINPIYRRFGAFNYVPGAFNEVSGQAEREDVAFTANQRPSVIVTTSGMLNGGPVVEYARRLLPDPRHRIVFAGYQDEGAPSQALKDLGRPPYRVQVKDESGETIEFKAAMPAKYISLSSHADLAGIIEYAKRLQPRHIALVHGEPEGQQVLRSRLLELFPRVDVYCGPGRLEVP